MTPLPPLVISNPPHGTLDAQRAATLLGLLPVEVMLKFGYTIPEIWLAPDDLAAATAAATELAAAGLSVSALPAEEFRDVPAQQPVDGFAFEGTKLIVEREEAEHVLTPDLPLLAGACTPAGSSTSGPDGRGAWGSFVDIYVTLDAQLYRFGVIQGRTDFSGLPGVAMLSAAARLAKFVAECETRLTHAVVDHRLLHLRLRRRLSASPTSGPQRRGFSCASPGFNELMSRLSPDLADISQPELCSRLVYLTRR